MKRRLFLKGLLGASAIAPVIVEAVTEDEPKFEHKQVSGGFIVSKGSIPPDFLDALKYNQAKQQLKDAEALRSKPEKLTKHEIEYGENSWFGLAQVKPEGGTYVIDPLDKAITKDDRR